MNMYIHVYARAHMERGHPKQRWQQQQLQPGMRHTWLFDPQCLYAWHERRATQKWRPLIENWNIIQAQYFKRNYRSGYQANYAVDRYDSPPKLATPTWAPG